MSSLECERCKLDKISDIANLELAAGACGMRADQSNRMPVDTMRISFLFALALAFAPTLWASSSLAKDPGTCGGDMPCKVAGGEYFIHLPAGQKDAEPLGAILYLHGHRGKALNAVRNKSFQKMADELGVAFVAVQGVNGTWSFPTAPRHLRDEPVFF